MAQRNDRPQIIQRLRPLRTAFLVCSALSVLSLMGSCAGIDSPAARGARVPSPTLAKERAEGVNERPDSVIFLPLGTDVLVPQLDQGETLPTEMVGPFELRSETLAGALQLILADYDVSLAFESDEGLIRTITVANLRGPLNKVVDRVCALADLYCAYEDGTLIVKETQTFTVTVPPVGGEVDILSAVASGVQAITGGAAVTEAGTRTIIYEATNRTAEAAERYFQRLRANTALVVFEVYIWEVSLSSANSTGINWEKLQNFGKFNTGIRIPGGSTLADATPVSIGIPTTENFSFGASDVLEFISTYGAVKTISQPQVTVLSGTEATLRAADTVNYVSSLTRTIDQGEVAVSTETDSVDTGFTMTISSTWDSASIYANIGIELQEVTQIETFTSGEGTDSEVSLQLPETTERELNTQVRIRPGDSLLIGGLVRESDDVDRSGPGFNAPALSTSRSSAVSNTEVVFLLRPKVVVYTTDTQKVMSQKNFEDLLRSYGLGNFETEPEKFPKSSVTPKALNPSAESEAPTPLHPRTN